MLKLTIRQASPRLLARTTKITRAAILKPLLVLSYVVMGLVIIIAFKPMIQMVPRGMIIWLFIGGACYILGIVFYLWKKLPYHHPIWHLFVMGGSISHFLGILFYLT